MSNRQRQQLAFISEFDTDIAHVPGLENVVVDALTRQYDDEKVRRSSTRLPTILQTSTSREIASEQPPISDEQASALELEAVQFSGVDQPVVCGHVARMTYSFGSRDLPEAYLRRNSQFVPPIREDDTGNGHQGRMCGRRCVVTCYVGQGSVKHARRARWRFTLSPPVIPILVPLSRFEHVHVDHVGSFPPDRGFRYLLTIIDRTTKWPETIPIAKATSETVLQAFLDHWISRFGVPITMTSDRGTQFTSEGWRKALGGLGINVSATTSYHP